LEPERRPIKKNGFIRRGGGNRGRDPSHKRSQALVDKTQVEKEKKKGDRTSTGACGNTKKRGYITS